MSGLASHLQSLTAKTPKATAGVLFPPNGNHASEFYIRLVDLIERFDSELDDAHEVGVRLVNFGQTVTIRLDDMGYSNPSLMTFSGTREDTGDPVELIQHVTQISILLTSLPRVDPSVPKKKIGFAIPEGNDSKSNE